jgi:adenosylmethionine-8-amino-7-oxononanoate aminotransferase
MAKTKPNEIVVHRNWQGQFPTVSRAEGIYVFDTNGKRYIDASGGSSAVVAVGHGVDEIPEAMFEQSKYFSFHPAHLFTNDRALELGELISSLAPGEMRGRCKIWLTCTGTDATDDSIRLARQHFMEQGLHSRFIIISRWQSFHGNNVFIEGIGGHTLRRKNYVPMFRETPHIPPVYCYRCPFEKTYPACDLLCARELERMICQSSQENIAGFIAEPVVGAALGAVPAPPGYFIRIKEICEKYGVLFIADEVMTGWGRTGKMFAVEHDGITPDIIATAKGMSSGYTPISAVIGRNEVWRPLQDHSSVFSAGHTLNSNAISCAGAISAIRYLVGHDLVENSRIVGDYFLGRLEELLGFRTIGDVRGKGLMLGFEIVSDKRTKKPFPSGMQMSVRLQNIALEKGLIIYSCAGCVAGVEGDMILLAPPLTISRQETDEVINLLKEAIKELERKI